MLYPAGNETCSSDDESTLTDSSSSLISCAEELDDSFTHEADNQDTQCYFDLGLGNRGLRIGSWNVEGLTLSKFDQIGLFMLSSDNRPQIDILSINESHLKPSTPDSLFDVPGFDMHRRDRKGSMKKGGVLVYVNKELKHRRRTDLEDSGIEIIWLEVYPYKSNRPLLFAGVYRRPAYLKDDDELLEKNIESAYLLNLETIISGDTNVNYLEPQVFKKHRLIRALTSMHFKQLVTQITRPISKTCLDHIFSNRPGRIHSVCVRVSGLADHLPVFAVRSYKGKDCPRARGKHSTIIYRNMKGFDETKFLTTLKEVHWDTVFVFDDMGDMLDTWEQLFNKALDSHCPWRGKRVAREKQVPWMTADVLKHLHRRDSLLKIARVSGSLEDWDKYKMARNRASNAIKTAKKNFFSNCFENNKGNTKGIWKTINTLTNINNKKTENSEIAPSKSADDFNKHFASIADRLRSLLPSVPFDRSKLENFVLSRKDPEVKFRIPDIKSGFVFDSLRCLKANKARGVDKLGARFLKIASPEIAPSLTKLMNFSFSSSVFPKRWKIAKVAPLFKSGDREDLNNYRPISVLPILSKTLERHVHIHLYEYLLHNNLLYARQSGFRKNHGTETALIKIVDDLLFNLDKNRLSGMVFIDYRKAFDMVDHTILISKLRAYGLEDRTADWFSSYLDGRQQFVSHSDANSEVAAIPHGVPQGSILGPLLFVVF